MLTVCQNNLTVRICMSTQSILHQCSSKLMPIRWQIYQTKGKFLLTLGSFQLPFTIHMRIVCQSCLTLRKLVQVLGTSRQSSSFFDACSVPRQSKILNMLVWKLSLGSNIPSTNVSIRPKQSKILKLRVNFWHLESIFRCVGVIFCQDNRRVRMYLLKNGNCQHSFCTLMSMVCQNNLNDWIYKSALGI